MQSNLEHVLHFHEDGSIETLHTDLIPLQELGKVHNQRVSSIEWNAKTQQWEVWNTELPDIPEGSPRFTSPSRDACLEWERKEFNKAMMDL